MPGRNLASAPIHAEFMSRFCCRSKRGIRLLARAPSPRRAATTLLTVMTIGAAQPALAQELYALAGGQNAVGLGEGSYSYSYEYLQNLTEHFLATYTYLNEGHVTNHHRDGHSLQLWYRWLTLDRELSFAVGVGPYRYYDTTIPPGSQVTTDEHGFGVLGSASINWYFRHPWVVQLRYNYAHTDNNITTNSYQIGIGYEFDPGKIPGPSVPPPMYGFTYPQRNEMSLMFGKSVLNNFQSPEGAAWGVEYRYKYTPYVSFSGAVLDEGENGTYKRAGVAVEVWLTQEFLNHRAEVGIGGGPYLARTRYPATGDRTDALGLLTVTIGYRWTESWISRFYWYRTVTNNGTDSDIIFLGLGYAF
jgi:hypothetical protein